MSYVLHLRCRRCLASFDATITKPGQWPTVCPACAHPNRLGLQARHRYNRVDGTGVTYTITTQKSPGAVGTTPGPSL